MSRSSHRANRRSRSGKDLTIHFFVKFPKAVTGPSGTQAVKLNFIDTKNNKIEAEEDVQLVGPPSQFSEIIGRWSYLSVPAGVFIASLVGSSHCAAMCGPVAITVHSRIGYLPLYHLGRLASYLSLGVLAGLLGEKFLSNNYPIISRVSLILLSLFLIYTGSNLVRGKHLELIPARLVTSLLTSPGPLVAHPEKTARCVHARSRERVHTLRMGLYIRHRRGSGEEPSLRRRRALHILARHSARVVLPPAHIKKSIGIAPKAEHHSGDNFDIGGARQFRSPHDTVPGNRPWQSGMRRQAADFRKRSSCGIPSITDTVLLQRCSSPHDLRRAQTAEEAVTQPRIA